MLISWSAGLDSTYLLLCELFSDHYTPKLVRTISINSVQILPSKKEKEQRKIIKNITYLDLRHDFNLSKKDFFFFDLNC